MCQPMPMPSCPTIKANARLRRSRKWKDQCENKSPNGQQDKSAVSTPKKNTRRRRRPTKKEQLHNHKSSSGTVSDCDTASTASMGASDDSLSGSSSNGCSSSKSNNRNSNKGNNKSPQQQQRRKRSKKSSKSGNTRPAKVVNIVQDLTEEEKSRYIALDAEMVGVGPSGRDSRLARVSLVDWDGEVVYDTHVKVEEVVTDYRTFVSGITREDLESDDAVTFDEAHTAVSELLEGKILVGHGLKNDFRVLGLSHPWHSTRDTAKYEPFMKPLDPNASLPFGTLPGATHVPKKLKVLAKDKLGMLIQEEGQAHSPIEDAVAALELYKKHRGKWEKAMSYKMKKTQAIMAQ